MLIISLIFKYINNRISQQELVKNLKEKVIQLSEENCELSLRCNEDDTESNIGDNWEHSAEELQFKIIEYNIKLTEMGYGVYTKISHSNCILIYCLYLIIFQYII